MTEYDRTTTVSPCGFEMEVTYDWEPARRSRQDDYDGGEPGNSATATLTACKVGGVDIIDFLSRQQIALLEDLICCQNEG